MNAEIYTWEQLQEKELHMALDGPRKGGDYSLETN